MQDLYTLVHSLTSGEWQALQGYFTCFTLHDDSRLKYLQLATLLMQTEECPSDKSCCLKLYGVKSSEGFRKLKFRLKEKILDFLLTDISSDKKDDLDEADYSIIKMKKKSAQFQQLFYSKKRMPILYELLDEIIATAKEFEQYSMLVDHLRIKKTIIASKNGREEFEKVHAQMVEGAKFSAALNMAEHYYSDLMITGDFSAKPDKQKTIAILKKNIAEISAGSPISDSPLVRYYLKNLEMGYYELLEDYPQARSICLELLNIVRNNKSVTRRQRIGVVYDNLSRCEFFMNNFDEAVKCAQEAQKHFNLKSENYCIALEQEFYALFALKNYNQSAELAKKMLASATRNELGEFRFAKYNCLLANALFKLKRFEEALQLLSIERGLAKDKAGWEFGLRVLTIMNLVETLKLGQASLAVDSLRKFVAYTDKNTPVSMRDKTILNLLIGAERKGFMFSQLNGKTQGYIANLTNKNKALRWEPFTHELIPFHEWFAGKMKRKMPVIEIAQSQKEMVKQKASTR